MFDPYQHKDRLLALLEAIIVEEDLTDDKFFRLIRRHKLPDGGVFSKSQLIRAYRVFVQDGVLEAPAQDLIERIRRKPVRTLSGVTPVTVMTKPYPCPRGQCIFCPTDVCMPKSYLPDEPGAQRAATYRFDPYVQTFARLTAYWNIGHPTDKVEMIILGGTWSAYPPPYQRRFIKRIFDALNDFGASDKRLDAVSYAPEAPATWEEVVAAQRRNETAPSRCVGLVVETRPDYVTPEEVERLRRLGCTKVQIGVQSLDDAVLAKNRRGHDVAAARCAFRLLRGAGFKIQAHWMANLYGSSPEQDIADFARLFDDPDFRPDELKIYPCSLIDGTVLMDLYRQGRWRPYTDGELRRVLAACLARVPPYCRVTRLMRDIPAHYIVDGTTMSNFRQVVERELDEQGVPVHEIRAREVRAAALDFETLRLDETTYSTSTGQEVFLQFVTPENKIAGFLRLCLPDAPGTIGELGSDAMIREVHVYGQAVDIGAGAGDRAQHGGLGTRLVRRAQALAVQQGYARLHVISAVGTREYYRKLGFCDGELYQFVAL
ncbi:MAG: tRNA uridine(34) 5-carboxymethylaminomethyl modification radical SAM/GNAT enzyme Elp3 [Anaerolineae bacterium]|nr:tRNA uridine(34) 5-carboxymethylaminomethyl modification radical SAM/GNAT enzyme Elp3 [Anaerolineae bacterium]